MRARVALILSFALAISASDLQSDSSEPPATDLRGLHAVGLTMSCLCAYSEFEEALKVLRPQVETQLREAGLRVVSDSDHPADESTPDLQVRVCCSRLRSESGSLSTSIGPDGSEQGLIRGFVFTVDIDLFQQVRLARNSRIQRIAATWHWGNDIGALGARPFIEIRKDVLRGTAEFISSWRDAAHSE